MVSKIPCSLFCLVDKKIQPGGLPVVGFRHDVVIPVPVQVGDLALMGANTGGHHMVDEISLTVTLTRWMFPYFFCIGLVALCMGILNVLGQD